MRKNIFIALAAFSVLTTFTPAVSASAGASPEPYVYFGGDSAQAASYLGVDTRNLTPEMLAPLHLKNENGVEVTMVDQDAPAGKAGIKEHDVITNINGEPVESVEQLRRLIHEIPPGRTVTIGLRRDGQPLTVKAQLASRNEALPFGPDSIHLEALKAQLAAIPKEIQVEIPPMPEMNLPVSVVVVHSVMHSGLMLENLTPQLGDYFGVKNGHGLLVRSVEKGSLAEKAGFRAGDVIVRVNGQPVQDSSDVGFTLRSRNTSTASVVVLRDKKELTLTLKLPPRDQSEIQEESFAFPEISQEMHAEVDQMRSEMAKVQPQIEAAIEQARKAGEQATRQALQNHEQWEKQAQEFRKQGEQMRKQWREQERKLRQELHSKAFDI